jgi:hypothetical protein
MRDLSGRTAEGAQEIQERYRETSLLQRSNALAFTITRLLALDQRPPSIHRAERYLWMDLNELFARGGDLDFGQGAAGNSSLY